MSLLCNIDAQLQQLPHMIKQIMSGLACKRTQFQGNPARKKGKAYGLCPFKSTGTVLFLPHPKRRPALDRVSFCLYRKEFLAIVGPSGCGKSTILSLIAGLLTPGSGGITFYGENGHQPGIGYMLQHDLLFEWRNVWQNVTLGLEIAHKDTTRNLERVRRMLSDYGLLEFQHKKPSQLSGGMRQRAALIRTMALEPDILLLDEPFSALDYQTRLTVSADIAAMIRKAEKSVILITHDLAEAISLADRVLILSARPARVKAEFPIHLTAADHSPLAARRAPEYGQLFNQIWEELSNENN